jgi:rhodanese-related sulfurtransferase
MSIVTAVPVAAPADAPAHFRARLALETDCADVHHALAIEDVDFVLVDARSTAAYAAGHVPGAVSLPHAEMAEARLAEYPPDTVFVVYCAGPHCNGAQRAGANLAALGRPVKEMIGGITGWVDEGYALTR